MTLCNEESEKEMEVLLKKLNSQKEKNWQMLFKQKEDNFQMRIQMIKVEMEYFKQEVSLWKTSWKEKKEEIKKKKFNK